MLLYDRLKALLFASVGAAAFYVMNAPLPMLFGPMVGCLIAALAGMRFAGVPAVSLGARTVLGVTVGVSITPQVIERVPDMIGSILLIPLYIALVGAVGAPFFSRLFGYDRVTAYYAAMPGGLPDLVIFGQEAGGDVRALSLIHATRVLMIVMLAPVLMVGLFGASLSNPLGAPAAELPAHELVLMALAAVLGWKAAQKVGLFGAPILGPMIATAALSLMGVLHFRPPAEAILAAQFFIGIGVGVQYVGVKWRELRRHVFASGAFAVILAAISAGVAMLAMVLGLASPAEAFLSFAPGGQSEMTVLAIIVGADLGFVIAHHVIRVALVILGAPIFFRLFSPPGQEPVDNQPNHRENKSS